MFMDCADQTPEHMDLEARVKAGETLESADQLTEEYRELLLGMVEFTANSEFIGAYSERPWIEKAPSFQRKLALEAKVQDEIGHAQMQYRLAENLGRDREDMLTALLNGEAGFGNAFHYPVEEWLDIAMIAWLVDGAAMFLQHSLMRCSYGPYARIMRRICREEEFHVRHGRHIAAEYATGSRAMQEALQEAVDRWWPRAVMFYGLSDEQSEKSQRMIELDIKPESNDTYRQQFFDSKVPELRELGVEVPDDKLEYDEEAERWRYTEPDWDEFKSIVTKGGPAFAERVDGRLRAFEENEWVRDALAAYHEGAQGRFSNGPAAAAGD